MKFNVWNIDGGFWACAADFTTEGKARDWMEDQCSHTPLNYEIRERESDHGCNTTS